MWYLIGFALVAFVLWQMWGNSSFGDKDTKTAEKPNDKPHPATRSGFGGNLPSPNWGEEPDPNTLNLGYRRSMRRRLNKSATA